MQDNNVMLPQFQLIVNAGSSKSAFFTKPYNIALRFLHICTKKTPTLFCNAGVGTENVLFQSDLNTPIIDFSVFYRQFHGHIFVVAIFFLIRLYLYIIFVVSKESFFTYQYIIDAVITKCFIVRRYTLLHICE